MKNLLLSIELAIESSPKNALDFNIFMDCYRSVSRE
jgi:hypothetical protein